MTDLPFSAPCLTRLRRRLLAWFDLHARPLPWRRDRSPYSIWISEVMLQQTQVATVIPYFERFLTAFPNLKTLAGADETDVLRLWQGLGYYRRARDLLRAARLLVARYDGAFPVEPAALGSLPGMGRYTVNAVLSQAFDTRLPILEANSRRVLARLGGLEAEPGASEKTLWSWAEQLLPRRRAGDFNQALMELGATVCFPREPNCGRCPLRAFCVAHREGKQATIPSPPKRAAVEEVREIALLIRRGKKFLFVQRPSEGRWANMWEFPHAVWPENEERAETGRRLLQALGIDGEIEESWGELRHGVTRFRITLHAFSARYRGGAQARHPRAILDDQ